MDSNPLVPIFGTLDKHFNIVFSRTPICTNGKAFLLQIRLDIITVTDFIVIGQYLVSVNKIKLGHILYLR